MTNIYKINRLKVTTLAMLCAVTTLLGSGQAMALDFTTSGVTSGNQPAPGCGTGHILLKGGIPTGPNDTQTVQYFLHSSSGSEILLALVYSTWATPTHEIGLTSGPLTNSTLVKAGVEEACPNLTDVSLVSNSSIAIGAAENAALDFVGVVFDATDTTDGNKYRYTAGFEGVTNTQVVFRREFLELGATTQAKIVQTAKFIQSRANKLVSHQVRLSGLLQDKQQLSFSANSGSLKGAFSQGNMLAELSGSWSDNSSYALATFGAHSKLHQDLLVGAMLQYDFATDTTNKTTGRGWMVGPYFVAQIPDQPLYLEGRLLYGQTENEISPLDTYIDSFQTERWLAQLRTTGEYKYQNTTLMPLLDFSYSEDTQKAYTDSLGNPIGNQKVSLLQFTTGVDFSTPISTPVGSLELIGGLAGTYSATDGAAATPEFENWRGRAQLGVNYATKNGANISATASYDGIGTGYKAVGAKFGFDMKF